MGDSPGVKPTHSSADAPSVPATDDVEAPLGTMQMPRGQEIPPAGRPPPMPGDDGPAPVMPTLQGIGQPVDAGAPPEMPADQRYEVTVEIARGGMGRVVEANDTVLGRTVALKEVLTFDPDTLKRFQREIRITARLEHPAIVPVHDAGVSPNGAPFYVMRKVSGRALEQLVAAANEVPQRIALVPHIVTAAHAIAHAHERGIVHRDIKPSNILVGDLGETIVIDWGLAKAMGETDDTTGPTSRVLEDDDNTVKTRAGIVYGTPGFMAPEQLRGKPVDEKCDVYALGATLYHLLARRPPHHHKQADVMMRAAVDGPPIPLLELVPTVPPELATIVEKALAHDSKERYQNAGALADDLQAYLTGQLVGSHSYSAGERFWRFVKRNRTAVTVGLVATIALLVGTVIAFAEIRDQRDRADAEAKIATTQKRAAEDQREAVLQKARELLLLNARHASQTDPTRAAAMIKSLVTPELWRQARDVGAAARANGIAFSLPLSKRTLTLELSRDGERALASGEDGIVRIVDLQKRSTKEIFNAGGAVMARFADGERKIILYQGNRLWILDTASGDKREITATTQIAKLETSGPLAYWVDTNNAVWKLDLAGGPPVPVELSEPVTLVMPSPDGRWIAYGGTKHLLLADRSNPSQPAENMSEGITTHLTWSADSKRLAVQIDDEVLDINTQPSPQIFDRFLVGARFGLAYSGGHIFSSGPTGIRQLARPESRIRLNDPSHTLGVHQARGRVVISAKPQGEIVVLSEYGDHTLTAPSPIQAVATSAQGPWIAAAAEGMLLVWSLEAFEPRSFEASPPTSARFVTGDSMIVTYFDDSADWIDLRTRKETALGLMPAIDTVIASPDGAEAIAIDSTHRAWHVAGVGQPKPIADDISRASFVDDTRFVLAGAGKLRLEDQRNHTQQILLEHAAVVRDLVTLADGGGWIAASFADGKLWRKSLASGVETQLTLPAPLPPKLPIAISRDGLVIVGAGSEVRAWYPDGRIEAIATGIEPVHDIALVEPTTVLALSEDGTGHLVDVRAKTITSRLSVAPLSSVAANGSLIASPTVLGGVEVIDPVAQWRWPLATPLKGMHQPVNDLEISPDGTRVLGLTQHSVVVWTLALPGTLEETASWLDKMTNATADSPSGPLVWR